jgi:precorrin-6A/cobalt-precorrin-6A reductase
MHVLILGGTAEARALALALTGIADVRVTSSLAGSTRDPRLPAGRVVSGGFGGADGLAEFLRVEGVDSLVDATHPFAVTMSANAVAASRATGTPLIALQRPPWRQQQGDRWHPVSGVPAAAVRARELCPVGAAVFVTTGRRELAPFAPDGERRYVIRVVDEPAGPLPPHREVISDRGPYTRAAETALMRQFGIRVLVTRNSGGDLTQAKIEAARDLELPVVMVARPESHAQSVASVGEVLALLNRGTTPPGPTARG